MKKFNCRFLLAVIGSYVYLMMACTEQKPSTNATPQPSANSTVGAQENKTAKTPQSNKLDACETLPKAEVEKIIGDPVKSADLSRVTEGTSQTAAFSQCTYKTSGGQSIEFFARRSPISDNTPEAIQKLRDTMKGLSKLEDVSGLGKTAFWVSGPINQLHVFEGENIYLYLTMRGLKAEADAKTKAVELARQAISNLSK